MNVYSGKKKPKKKRNIEKRGEEINVHKIRFNKK